MNRGVKGGPLLAVAAVGDTSSIEAIKQTFSICLPEFKLQFVRTDKDCLAMLKTQHPAIVLMDRFLDEIDSITTIKFIRDSSNIPIILFSYDRDEGSVVAALDSGADGYLAKPLREMELAAYVKRLVKSRN
jgi:DNA-binding response OmpR family regulator